MGGPVWRPVLGLLLQLLLLPGASADLARGALRFGLITDLHYADWNTTGTRYYRDSIPKARDAVKAIDSYGPDLLVNIGDIKDVTGPCGTAASTKAGNVSAACVAETLGFVDRIQGEVAGLYRGPIYHVLGNHDVDILSQPEVLSHLRNFNQTKTLDHYAIRTSTKLRFLVLNGNFNAASEPWSDLNSGGVPGRAPHGEAWDGAWVNAEQLEWLAEELAQSKAAGERVIVFLHYRLDGGPGGPVNCTAATECGRRNNSAWVDDCTLKNAAAVRDVLVGSEVVLATFGGHDHIPYPPWSTTGGGETGGGVLLFTHHGMIEGSYASSNAYSVVDVDQNCTIRVTGFANATSLTYPGPAGCTI